MRVYLAGPINHQTYDESIGWRAEAEDQLAHYGIEALSPLRGKEWLKDVGVILDSYENTPLTSQRGITTRDRFDVQSSDVVLANFLGAKLASCGTPIEFGWADANDIPVVMVMESEGNPFDHPMMREIAGFRVETLDAGLLIVRALLNASISS
tara:strand:- start:656 stop:1114 length:459 start_codon:yes stop_codon:yes gene_type:complete